jgi:hypothetical protein
MAVLHADIERLIAAARLESTIIRPGMFASNALFWRATAIRADGVVRWPYGAAETAPVDDRDVAAVAARTLPKRDGGKLAAPGRGHAARRVGRNDWKAGVHHLYGVRHPRIGGAIVSPLGRRSRHRVYGRSNPIELTFATVRHRTKVTKGPGSKAAGIAMAFKLIEAAQERWRAVSAPHLVALVPPGPASNAASSLNATPYSRPPKPPTTPPVQSPAASNQPASNAA